MLPTAAPHLTQAELLRLDAFMHSPACGREAMSLSQAHGFLTALASGPGRLEPAEWLRLIFDEPVFTDGAQAEDILGLALRLYRDIEVGLEAGQFSPVVERGRTDGSYDASAWCRGYQSGMSLFPEVWAQHASAQLSALLSPIHTLARGEAMDESTQRGELALLAPSVTAIHRYWRDRAGRFAD
ncbi:MAG: YecA family protein [Thiobacillaceae bacterium]|nr:YecA family protein [Thiobacillaceae bacterium]